MIGKGEKTLRDRLEWAQHDLLEKRSIESGIEAHWINVVQKQDVKVTHRKYALIRGSRPIGANAGVSTVMLFS